MLWKLFDLCWRYVEYYNGFDFPFSVIFNYLHTIKNACNLWILAIIQFNFVDNILNIIITMISTFIKNLAHVLLQYFTTIILCRRSLN